MTGMKVTRSLEDRLRDENGMALLIAIVLLLLMSALGLTALQHAQDEATASGRARRKDATLYAAEAGLALAQETLISSWGGAEPAAFTIDQPSLVRDGFSNPIAVRSGRPENAAPQPITPGGSGNTTPPNGFMLNGGPTFAAVPVNVVATDQTNGMVHLQAQYRVLLGSSGSGGGQY